LTRQFLEHEPDFILHTGDLVVRGADYDTWLPQFFQPLADVMAQVPFFAVLGNHEQDGTNFTNFLHLPGNRHWYSFDAGPVHVLVLDFHFEKANQEQYAFARQDLLASHAPWKIVSLHVPFYNISGHASSWGHIDYLPLLHGTKVDLAVTGHSHLYERFRPLTPAGQPDGWAVTHITTGGGGAPLVKSQSHPALAANESCYHFLRVDADPEAIRAKTIRSDGSILDQFEIRKSAGRLAPEYLAQAYSESSLDLFYETAPSLIGRASALPDSAQPAEVKLSILPRNHGAAPAQLEIGLAPESRAAYELLDGPLRTQTPPVEETNTVIVQVRTKDQARVTQTSDHALVPPLTFQAKVSAPQGETIAYGATSRVQAPSVTTLSR
jgi:hypothetical protein